MQKTDSSEDHLEAQKREHVLIFARNFDCLYILSQKALYFTIKLVLLELLDVHVFRLLSTG